MDTASKSDKVEDLIEQTTGRLTNDSGKQASNRARQAMADVDGSTRETLRDATEGAANMNEDGLVRLVAPLEHMPASVYLAAMVGSIVVSVSLYLTGRRWAGIFVGLWAPTFLNLGMYLKQLHPSRAG
jgi:hypothetical protein